MVHVWTPCGLRGAETAKREAFMKFMGKGVDEVLCPYGVLVRIIEQDLGGSVIDVLLDEEDSRRGPVRVFKNLFFKSM